MDMESVPGGPAAQSEVSQIPSKDQFKILQLLGEGGFGQVYLCQQMTGIHKDCPYAMKIINTKREDRRVKGSLDKEIKILSRIGDQPFLINLHYAFQNPQSTFMVFDYIGGGDVESLMKRRNNGNGLEIAVVRFMVAECVLALEYLHSQGIIHRDIKPANILIDFEGHAVLSDMGLASILRERTDSCYSLCGTTGFVAPEMFRRKPVYDEKVDWWSLGVTTYVMLLGESAMPDSFKKTLKLLKSREVDLRLPENLWHKAADFLRGLIKKVPGERFGATVKAQPFFCPFDWTALRKKQLKVPLALSHSNDFDVRYFEKSNNVTDADRKKQEKYAQMTAECTYVAPWNRTN